MSEPTECPFCEADLDNGDIFEFFNNKYGYEKAEKWAPMYGWSKETPRRFSKAIGIYDLDSDSVTHWKCPFCNKEWKRGK